METNAEFAEAQARKFMTVLFYNRARRHLKTMAALYGWSPETLQEHEQRFLRPSDAVPIWAPPQEKNSRTLSRI
jgi:hypothetical protein